MTYLVNDYFSISSAVLTTRLNELAGQGWRLVAVSDSTRFIFVKDDGGLECP